ncbi:MAG: hypothetical protein IH624_13545 [Phycisphaerae bacterium]|nr:hypothetical protein [Phycisphaerae bacterium]
MDHDNLMGIAMYVWEVRQATRAKALGRKALEKAIEEMEVLRDKVQVLRNSTGRTGDQNLFVTIDSLFQLTEDDILDRLAAIPSGVYDLPQFSD